ncbi:hypothetical protein [Phyllobacterium chamaecytisi]|uniref:hypothetical protein n=1 Tax=Phyllobacterium chamaecytisi TaxID=2876082 RepID=UPI001CCB9C74|nr:hypothetical protein [Phyllobacterium sp. KW56]MBZ9602902.1 hypothetical protein [Phyllobacterium sp. KW56]
MARQLNQWHMAAVEGMAEDTTEAAAIVGIMAAMVEALAAVTMVWDEVSAMAIIASADAPMEVCSVQVASSAVLVA